MEVAYIAAGNGPALVLVHAFPLDGRMWEPALSALMRKHTVILPSMRGFGRTPPAASATMDEMARDVAELMDRLGEKTAAVGGCSMGGYVALAFQRLFPARCAALVLADSRAGADGAEAKANRVAFAEAVRAGGAQVAVEKMLPKLLTPAASPSLRDWVEGMIRSGSQEGIAAALLGMRDRADSGPTLPGIQVPVLLVCGEKDDLTPPADSKAMAEKIPGAKYVELAGAGHLSPVEAPAEFADAVVRFLAAH
ncbi:MAG: alpha/beta fold hydrolase [Planctomycetes bacterium]|nr:alpha/beta fold hydrolase [Planctomycetota bacterium]